MTFCLRALSGSFVAGSGLYLGAFITWVYRSASLRW